MPRLKLTKTSIADLKIDSKIVDYFDAEVNGLTLRVFPSGAKAFSIIYRNNEGKQKRYTIGKYPSIPLAQAKKEAQRLLLLISQGKDIQEQKVVSKKVIQDGVFTFKRYLDSFYLEWYKQNRKSHQGVKNILINCCTPLHELKLIDLDKPKVNTFLYQYVSTQKVGNASYNRILSAVKGAITKAVEFGYLDENKLAGFKQQPEPANKIRYLSEAEKERLFQALDVTDLLLKHIVLVAYYTGMRRGEIFSLDWEDIDVKTNKITLDKTRTKSDKNRSIPMHSKVGCLGPHDRFCISIHKIESAILGGINFARAVRLLGMSSQIRFAHSERTTLLRFYSTPWLKAVSQTSLWRLRHAAC
ncbi:integrase arm-type DNA-binding domain-containing protein [Caedibacter taeniospiralis]|jgi:hypothetical protein|uniref:integrase arm-type DNA-binding domain-containing protein n=1 Tax=Caedibacter taeniospiralis TaxID=28907 RepID=UPI0037BFEF50